METLYFNRWSETPVNTKTVPRHVDSLVTYKSLTRNIKSRKPSGTHGTSDMDCLARRVLKECQNNSQMMNFLQSATRGPGKTPPSEKKATRKKKNHFSDTESSSPGSSPPRRRKRSRKASKKRRAYKTNSKNNSSSSDSWETNSESSADNSPVSKPGTAYTHYFNRAYK